MNGDGFDCLVREGQSVKQGTPLIRFDRDKIKAAGYPDTVIVVVTEPGRTQPQISAGMDVTHGQTQIVNM